MAHIHDGDQDGAPKVRDSPEGAGNARAICDLELEIDGGHVRVNHSKESREFLVGELEQARKDYDAYVEETRRLERYAVLVTGGIWSWCATHGDAPASGLLAWFPFGVCALFGLRAAAIHMQSRAARRFCVDVLRALGLSDSLSWSFDQSRQSKSVPWFVAATAYIFWLTAAIATVAVPLLFGHMRSAG